MPFEDPREDDPLQRTCVTCGKKDVMTVGEFNKLPNNSKKHCAQCQRGEK